MSPRDYITRCYRLARHGLSRQAAADLCAIGNVQLLLDLEAMTDAQRRQLSEVYPA